jgi:hypothetical protein
MCFQVVDPIDTQKRLVEDGNVLHELCADDPAAVEADLVDTERKITERLDQLEGHWSVRLASISDRVRRPFTTMLEQDDLEALVTPAVAELITGRPEGAGAAFEARAATFLGVASGSGVEVPEWLERLSSAVDRAIERADASPRGAAGPQPVAGLPESIPWVKLPWDVLKAALAG